MIKDKLRFATPYLAIPIIGLTLLFFQSSSKEVFYILQEELLVIFGYLAALGDLKSKKIPNTLVLVMLTGWLICLTPQLFINTERALGYLKDSLLGFTVSGVIFLLVYLISRQGLGGGDVKFMAVAGLYLGLNNIIPAMLYGTILAGLCGLVFVLLRKVKLKDTIPLVPFLYIGILLTLFLL